LDAPEEGAVIELGQRFASRRVEAPMHLHEPLGLEAARVPLELLDADPHIGGHARQLGLAQPRPLDGARRSNSFSSHRRRSFYP